MPEVYLELSTSEQKDILQTAAAELGMQESVLEKDIWVCWVLQALFSIPDAHPMAFKGGTSLSKVYNIIDRFSEDVDVTLDYRHFEDDFDPFESGASKTQTRKFSVRLKEYVKTYAKVFFNASYANYDACLENQLKLLPENGNIRELQADYEKMVDAGMMYKTPPDFAEITDAIRQIESDINKLFHQPQ